MIFEFEISYLIMFNGLYLKLKSNKVDINKIDSIMFYEMVTGI
jgi:hypothetical protein